MKAKLIALFLTVVAIFTTGCVASAGYGGGYYRQGYAGNYYRQGTGYRYDRNWDRYNRRNWDRHDGRYRYYDRRDYRRY